MIFDVFPSKPIVSGTEKEIAVQAQARPVLASAKVNHLFGNGDDLEIIRLYEDVEFGREPVSIDLGIELLQVDLTNPVPLPLAFISGFVMTENPEGSYIYTPQVVGGAAPYSFQLEEVLPQGWTFDTETGVLTSPPQ